MAQDLVYERWRAAYPVRRVGLLTGYATLSANGWVGNPGLSLDARMKARNGSTNIRRTRDPEQTKAEIINSATQEFATRGVKGARVDAIANRTRTTRAMIYYYFRSKEGLYLAVLEEAYRGIREAEKSLDLAHLPPLKAMRKLIGFTFDYYQSHPEFVALVVAENQSGGKFIRKVHRMHRMNVSIIDTISAVLHVGTIDGTFRPGIDPVDVHMLIAALGWFQIANRHTFGHLFGRDMTSSAYVQRTRALVIEVVLRHLMSGAPQSASDPINDVSPAQQ